MKHAQRHSKRNKLYNNFTIKIQGIHTISALLCSWATHIVELHINRNNPRGKALAEQAHQAGCSYQADDMTYAIITPLPEHTDEHLTTFLNTHTWRRLLLLDGITDTRNLGAIIRSACAFAIDAVIIPRNNAAAATDATYHASAGALVFTPLVRVNNLNKAIATIRAADIPIIGAVCEKDAVPLTHLNPQSSFALVMGSEDKGIRKHTRQLCDHLAYIPMYGNIDSLNVSVATAIMLHHLSHTAMHTKHAHEPVQEADTIYSVKKQ